MSVPKVSSDFISNVLNSYYANKGKSKDVKSERSAALGKNESGSSKSETSSSKYETSSSKYEERYYKAGSTKDDEDGSSRSEKTNSSKYYKSDSGMYDAYSLSKDYRASSNKDDESDSRRYDAYSSRQDDRPGSSKDYTKSKPSGKYEDYKDGSCTMEEDAYYDEMYPSHYDTYSDYPEYTHGNYPPMYLPEAEPPMYLPEAEPPTPRPPPHGLPPGRPFPPMGFPRPPMPRGPHHPYPRGPPGTHGPYPRGPPGTHYPYPRGPPFIERDGPRHQPPAHPYDRFDYPDDEYRGPPDNRYNDQRDDRPPKRRHDDDDDKHYNRYPKKFTSEKSAKEIYDFDKLPKVLTDMFTSATCNLCLVTLHQPGLMELHYRGKNHIKRMKGWLYKFTGEHHILTASEIEQIDAFEMKPNDIPGVGDTLSDDILDVEGTDVTYCKLCNIPISSAVVAKQHYSGKKHLKALKDSQLVEGEHSSKKPVDKLPDASKPKANSMCVNSRWFCHVCKVNSVSEEQYESHLIGKRHKKAWKATQVVAPVGLQNVAQSRHKPINYDIDPELLEDHDLSLYCVRCREHFTISAEFTYHACPESELLCKKCKTRFDSKPELKYHDCPRDHFCDKCEQCFDSLDAVDKHECGADNPQQGMGGLDSSFHCTLCQKSLNSVLSLDMHGKSRLHCALLHKLAELYPDLPADFNPIKTLPRIQYHCDKCDINFKDDTELEAHIKQGNHSIPIGVAKLGNFPPSDGQGLGNFPRHEKEGSHLGNFAASDKKPGNGALGGAAGIKIQGSNEVGAYDIRNIDMKELLKTYKK